MSNFVFPKLSRVTLPSGPRFYKCPTTDTFIASVTTIIGETSEKKNTLKIWQDRVGLKEATRVKNEACNLGELVHQHCEAYLQELPRKGGNHMLRRQAYRMADVLIDNALRPHVSAVHAIEASMIFPGLFAGTCDLLADLNGKFTICDYKTSKKMKDQKDIEDYKFQLAAYSLCLEETHEIEAESACILMVARDLEFKEFRMEKPEIREYRRRFLDKVEQYYNENPIPDLSGYACQHLG